MRDASRAAQLGVCKRGDPVALQGRNVAIVRCLVTIYGRVHALPGAVAALDGAAIAEHARQVMRVHVTAVRPSRPLAT